MVINMCAKPEISPTLEEIICHFDEDNQRSQTFSLSQNIGSRLDVLDATTDAFDAEADRFGANGYGLNDNSFGYHEVWNYDHDGGTSVVNEISSFGPFFHGDREVLFVARCCSSLSYCILLTNLLHVLFIYKPSTLVSLFGFHTEK